MIQDISPHRLRIEYKNHQPEDGDFALAFCGGELLLRDGEEISFLRCGDLPEVQAERLTYLFSLDGEKYFHAGLTEDVVQTLRRNGCRAVSRQSMRTLEPRHFAFAAITAFMLDTWYSKNVYCGGCSHKLQHSDRERMLVCPDCGNRVYPRINPAVIVSVVCNGSLLLTKYRGREYKNYALVAGFVEIGETFEAAVRREVMEEAGLTVKNIRYYASQPWAFTGDLLAGYICEVDGDPTIKMDDEELSCAVFIPREQLPETDPSISLTNTMICAYKNGEY